MNVGTSKIRVLVNGITLLGRIIYAMLSESIRRKPTLNFLFCYAYFSRLVS